MCGITGIYNLKSKDQEVGKQRKIVKKMTDKLVHRGPDDEGFFVDENIALGHRRLSILDLSPNGHQPMSYDHGNLTIVFNGEIYNFPEIKKELQTKGYQFNSRTDTEVVLASYQEWGTRCLQKFNGMWAFALYDRQKKLLFCARDRLGVKPFYYHFDQNKFIFASEAKAILAYPDFSAKPNEQMVWDYLLCGHTDHREETLFDNIKELRGGQKIVIRNQKIEISRYWDLKKIKPQKISDQLAAEKFRELFLDSVKLRLRSDVPVGTCLSGGLDSSAIVCAVNQFLKKEKLNQIGLWQKTFSASYDPKKHPKCDERTFIKTVINKTKAKPYYVFPSGKRLAQEIDDLIYWQDLPFGSTSIYAQYNVFRLASQKKIKVMLDGQGADEFLAGYHTFFPVYFQSLKEQKQYFRFLVELRAYSKVHRQPIAQNIAAAFIKTPLAQLVKRRFKPNLKNTFYNAYFDYSVFNQTWRNRFAPMPLPKSGRNSFLDQSYALSTTIGLPSLLRYEDRNSMAFSIESRTPFLDYRLVEFIYSLDDNQKIRRGQTKWIMRQALKGLLPEKIRTRQDKIGFATPEEVWFKENLAPQMRRVFKSKTFAARPYFEATKVQDSFEKFLKGEPIMYQLFWRLYNMELWLRRFID